MSNSLIATVDVEGVLENLENLAASVEGLTDLGYKFARVSGGLSDLAQAAAERMPGFPDNVSEEDKARVMEGFRLRKAELFGDRWFLRTAQDTYTEVMPMDVNQQKPENYLKVNVGYAFSYTQQQFGALKQEQKNLHAIVGAVRTDVNKFTSNCWGKLVATYKALHREPRERSNNATFFAYLDSTFEDMLKRRKTASNREGAANVPSEEALKAAIAAFRKKLG